jgi:hypothetical protein
MPKYLRYMLLGAATLLSACKKEVEKIVVQYSWRPAVQYAGNLNIFLGMGQGPDGLYLQQPGSFLTVEQSGGRVRSQLYTAPVTSDVNVHLPIGPNFFVTYYDSMLTVVPNKHIVTGQYYRDIRLKRLDPQARQVLPASYSYMKFGVINQSSYFLFGYLTNNLYSDNAMHLVLAQVPPFTQPAQFVPLPIPTPQVISIPFAGYPTNPSYPTYIAAIDNYFMVDCGNQGVYRIEENGSYRRVLSGRQSVTAFYKWKGRVYAHTSDGRIGFSDTDGLSWQFVSLPISGLRYSTMHMVGDSLVGVYRGYGGGLFTLRWNSQSARLRQLKDDGLNQADVTGLEVWRDTVYLATTGGLFKRSRKDFFESQP